MAPIVSPSRACAWFYANSGYEETKYSLALADWLLRSRARTEEQMTDREGQVFAFEWRGPHDSPVAMLASSDVRRRNRHGHRRVRRGCLGPRAAWPRSR